MKRLETLLNTIGTDPPFSEELLETAAHCASRWEATLVLTAAVVGLEPDTIERVVRQARPRAKEQDAADRAADRQ